MANAMKKPTKTLISSAKKAKPAVIRSAPVKAKVTTGKAAARTAAKESGAVTTKVAAKAAPKTATKKIETAGARLASKQVSASRVKSAPRAASKQASGQLKVSVTNKKSDIKAVAKPGKSAIGNDGKPAVSATAGSGVSQTTDAAVLAAIDTSGYVLPTVKVPGRRGRKPKEFQPENDEVAALNAVERAELKAVDKARARDRKAKEKALLKDAFSSDTEATEEELERRRQKLKTLIKLGKERGFLTYSEINDHLPENIVDPEAIEGIIGTFNDMGIAVYEHAPDAETLLLSDNVANVASDDDAEAAAEAALSTVDSDFGRTTDPVRMYMREMGSVELLTREGEIEIAKRIEDGLKDMIQAISACPDHDCRNPGQRRAHRQR